MTKLLSAAQAAELLGLATQTLAVWRSRGRGEGPRYVKAGARVLYALDDLDAWVAVRKRENTSQKTAPKTATVNAA
ncbi:hypothetical protein BH23GEM1_BH23GEM1_00520 [soil metagenome]